jgi:hypothetical protein
MTVDLRDIGRGRLAHHEDWTARQSWGEVLKITRVPVDPHAAFWAEQERKRTRGKVLPLRREGTR